MSKLARQSLMHATAIVAPLLLAATPPTHADTITVCWEGTGDYLTIQEGIDAAVDGDEVVVCDGTYTGPLNKNLDFGGRAIVVRSENGPEHCKIDCEEWGQGFRFHSGETWSSVLDGFTISNAISLQGHGGAIACEGSSPTIRRCRLRYNIAQWTTDGGGIYCHESSALIVDCEITGNAAHGRGGGIFCRAGAPLILNTDIRGNYGAPDGGGGIAYIEESTPIIVNCTISGNVGIRGGGISCGSGSSSTIDNCTIIGNSGSDGYGIYVAGDGVTISNSIIRENYSGQIYGPVSVTYSNVQDGWEGEGNIDADPLFVDADGPDDLPETWDDNDYHLGPGSPCIDAADNDAVPADTADLDDDGDTAEPIPFDLDGNPRFADDPDTTDTGNGTPPIVDMGAYEFQYVIPGDLSGDGCVDQIDLGILLAYWGWSGGGDCDGDGDTDQSDLGILLAHWGEGCE